MVYDTEVGAPEGNGTPTTQSAAAPAVRARPAKPKSAAKSAGAEASVDTAQKAVAKVTLASQPAGRAPSAEKTTLRRQTSRPEYRMDLVLNSVQAQRVFERSFQTMAYSLFALEVILRIMGEKPEVVNAVLATVEARIASMKQLIDQEARDLQAVALALGFQSPTYSQPVTVVAAISTPQVGMVAGMMRRMDEMMSMMDMLWLNGELTGEKRTAEQHRWERRFYSLAGFLHNLQARAREEAKRRGKSDEVSEQAPELGADETAAEVAAEAKIAAKQVDSSKLIPSAADVDQNQASATA